MTLTLYANVINRRPVLDTGSRFSAFAPDLAVQSGTPCQARGDEKVQSILALG
jgi:hypothetical protein